MPKLPTEFRASITVVGGDTLSFYFMRRAGRAGLVTDEASLSSRRPQSHRDDRHTCLRMHTHTKNTHSYATFLEGKLNSYPLEQEIHMFIVYTLNRYHERKITFLKIDIQKLSGIRAMLETEKYIKNISVNFAPHCFEFLNFQLHP